MIQECAELPGELPAAHSRADGTLASEAAGSSAVQLAMLRAELAASDAELEHVMAHLDILQHQQHAKPAAVVSVELSELDFLRQVGLRLAALAAVPAAGTRRRRAAVAVAVAC
jgi:hypothetical protein